MNSSSVHYSSAIDSAIETDCEEHSFAKESLKIFVAFEKSSSLYPGNGGCRISTYSSNLNARTECEDLALNMGLKHRMYSTGFTGAKIVVATKDAQTMDYFNLMKKIANVLNSHNRLIFTGSDLNTSQKEMLLLAPLTKLRTNLKSGNVLAGLYTRCDPNVSTGVGVASSVRECAKILLREGQPVTILVLGTGKVGKVVASYLSREVDFQVLVYDIVPGRAAKAVPFATDISESDWTTVPHDILVPCAASHIISESIADKISSKVVCGASNLPFAQ